MATCFKAKFTFVIKCTMMSRGPGTYPNALCLLNLEFNVLYLFRPIIAYSLTEKLLIGEISTVLPVIWDTSHAGHVPNIAGTSVLPL